MITHYSTGRRGGEEEERAGYPVGIPPLPVVCRAQPSSLLSRFLEHNVQSGDAALGGVPYGGVGQIDDIAVLVGIGSHDQLVLHDFLGELGAVSLNSGVPVHDEDVVGVLLHNELEGGLVAVGGGVDVSIHADVLKADLPADDGAAAVVAQHVEAAAGAHTHNGGLVRGEVGQGLDAGVKAGHQLVHLVFQTKHGGDGSGVLADALHHAQLAVGGEVDHGGDALRAS